MSDCVICTEKFNKSTHKPFECKNCDDLCCRECHITYIKDRNVLDCMFCSSEHTIHDIYKNHTQTFIFSKGKFKDNGLREWEENSYYRLELTFFPETQVLIDNDNLADNYNNMIKDCRQEIKELKKNRKHILHLMKLIPNYPNPVSKVNKKLMKEYRDIRKENIQKIKELTQRISDLHMELSTRNLMRRAVQVAQQINRCCYNDCDGFLNNSWICNKCSKVSCKDCREPKEEEHECDEEKKKNVSFSMRTTQGCPECGVRIHRIYGCDQMYCPMCKIIFSYRTGFRLFGTVHQPDAVRDLRLGIMNRNGEVPRDPADIPCGGVSSLRMKFLKYSSELFSNEKISRIFNRLHFRAKTMKTPIPKCSEIYNNQLSILVKNRPIFGIIQGVFQAILEWEDGAVRYRVNDQEGFNLNMSTRKNYMNGKITEEQFRKSIYPKYKEYYKRRDLREMKSNMMVTLSDMMREHFNRDDWEIMTTKPSYFAELRTLVIDILKIIQIYNEEFIKIAKIYGKKIEIFYILEMHHYSQFWGSTYKLGMYENNSNNFQFRYLTANKILSKNLEYEFNNPWKTKFSHTHQNYYTVYSKMYTNYPFDLTVN